MSKTNFIRNYVKKNLMKATDEGIMVIPNTQKVDFQEGILRQLLIENGINPDVIKSDGAMNEAMAFINQAQKTKAAPVATDAKVFDLEGQRLDPREKIIGGTQEESIKKNIAEATKKGDFKGIFNQVLRDPDIAREFAKMKKFPFSRDTNVRSGADAIPLARKAEFDEEMGIKSMAKDRDYSVEKLVSDFKKYGNATDKDIQTLMKSGKMGQIPYVMDNYGMSFTEVLDTLKRGEPLIEGMAKGGRAGFKAGLFSGRRTFLKTLFGNTEKNRKNRQLQKLIEEYRELQKSMEKNPQFKFPKKGDPEFDDTMLDIESKLAKDRLKSATGGRIGFAQGLGPRILKFLSENSPLQAAKKYNKSVKDRMQAGKELEVASEVVPIAASGALVTNQLKKMLKNMNEEQKKEQQDKMFKEFSQEYEEKYKDSPELLEKMLLDLHKNIYMEEKADGGRIGYKDGPKLDIQAAGSKSGKQQIKGAPEGITMDSETFNAIINADIPISQKIDLLGKFQYGKGRTRIEKDDQELFLDEGGFKSRDIGLGFNKAGEGIGGTLMYNLESGEPEFKIRFKKKFADGGRIGLKDGMDRRTFMKIMGGLATIPILGKFFKTGKTAKVAKDVSKVVPNTQPPDYFFSLAEKIKLLGKESKVKPQDRVNEYYYTGKNGDEYTLTEDVGTGDMQIIKDKTGVGVSGEKSFDVINDRTVMDYKKGRGDESTRGTPADEYEEYRVEFDQDGTMAGADDINEITKKEIVDEVSDNIPSIKKASGGLARMLGGIMSLTPPQYRQMKQFLESSSRLALKDGVDLTDAKIRKLFPTYFTPAALADGPNKTQLNVDKIRTILNTYSSKEGGTSYIANKLKLNESIISRILRIAKNKNLIKKVPAGEFKTKEKQRIYKDISERNIYKEVRVITANDRKINPNIPKNAKFKVQVPSGEKGTSTKMVYTTTESAAENAVKKADEFTIAKKLEKKKPFDRAVKAIHRIAMSDPTDINNARRLAGLIYGNTSDDALRMVAQDLIRYQEFLLGFREVPGIISPQGLMLDEILSEFPPQNQWGKFASEELRRSRLNIRDQLLKTKGKKLNTLRANIVKAINTDIFNLDEVVGVAATFENAPGYTELTQVIKEKINSKKGLVIDGPFSRLLPKVLDGTANIKDIENFNKVSEAFQKKFNVDTPIIVSEPGTKLDASKYIKNFDALSEPAKKNITDIATQKGVVIKTKGVPLTQDLKPGTPLYKQLMKFCPNAKANGGTVGTCSIDEAVTGMKNEITKVRTGAASAGEASRLANKFKNFGSKGMRTLFKAGVVGEVLLESALAFDKVISEGESTMQALRKSYLTAPLRGLGLMKSYDEGVREELIGAATDKDKVEFVLDQQELINDKNKAVQALQRLKDQYEQETLGAGNFGYTPDNKQDILKKITDKQADIKDKYRSGKLSRAEKLISGFDKPMDLKINDRAYYDALVNAQERLSVINAPKFVPSSERAIDMQIQERIKEGDMLTPEKIDEFLKEQSLPIDETVDILGGYDQILKDAGTGAIAQAGGVANLSGGGLAKLAGDRSGAMLENKNPDKDGLPGLLKRGIKT